MRIEKKYWKGLLNADAADFVVGEEEYVNAANLRWGSTDFAAGAVGYMESIGSNRLINNPFLPPGENITVGSTYDIVGNRIIYFNYRETDEQGTQGIYCYDIAARVVRRVLVLATLGLTKDCIHSCFVINGNLYWTNSVNSQPKRINIDSGIRLYDPTYASEATAYTQPINDSVISWIRRPPVFPPVIDKVTQTVPALEANFIKFEAFQICYRYVFRDYEVSTISGYSLLSNYNRETDTYNRVDIEIPLDEQIEQDVLQVDLVVRFVSGNFFIIKSWNKNVASEAAEIVAHNAGTTPLSYAYYNNQVGLALDSAYANKAFDSVPIYAETCATAKGRTFLGNYISGYDTPLLTSLTVSPQTGTPTDRLFKSEAFYQLSVTFYDEYQRKSGYFAPATARIETPDVIYGTFTTPTYVTQLLWNLSNVNAAAEIPEWAFFYSVDITRCLRTRFFMQLRGFNSTYVRKNENGIYEFGIEDYSPDLDGIAFDISRLSAFGMGYVFTEGDIFKYYRYTDLNFTLAITGQQGVYVITELMNLGTLNASTPFLFEIYTPYKLLTNEPVYEVGFLYEVNRSGGTRQYTTQSGFIDGDVYLLERTELNRVVYSINPVPSPITGDVLITIGVTPVFTLSADATFAIGDSPMQDLTGFNIATNTDRVIFENLSASAMTLRLSGNIEIMADTTRSWKVHVGDNNNKFTILIPNMTINAGERKKHFFNNQQVSLGAGDRLFILHEMSDAQPITYYEVNLTIEIEGTEIPYDVEAMSPNDKFWRNWNFPDTGRPNFIDTIGQVKVEGGISYSNTYIPNARVNGLSSFEALNAVNLSPECGPLRKLLPTSKVDEPGIVMLGICEAETASLYLGEVQLLGSSANAFLAQSENVIGTINVLKGSFGTLNPESAKEIRGNGFWYDIRNGKYIQYSSNGLFPISNYQINKFWRLFSEKYQSLSQAEIEAMGSRPFVFTGFDMHNEELLVSIPKVGNPPRGYLPDYPSVIYPFDICDFQAKSLVYRLNIEPNRWQGSYDITAENYVNGQNELYSFKNGNIYLHNDSASFNNFYGVQYRSSIMLVANQVPGEPKLFLNNHVKSNLVPVFVYFRTEDAYVQASDLVDFDFENLEGVFYGPIYRNKLIPTVTGFTSAGLLTAEVIRGDTLKAMYQWDVSTTPVQLRFITIGYQLSRGHLK